MLILFVYEQLYVILFLRNKYFGRKNLETTNHRKLETTFFKATNILMSHLFKQLNQRHDKTKRGCPYI